EATWAVPHVESPSLLASVHRGVPAYELKLLLSEAQVQEIGDRVAGVLHPDPHADPKLGNAYAQTKRGLFEVAQGGTLFIDEIAEMSPGMQAKLLRVLEDGHFRRVGGTQEFYADVRVIAATNKMLEDEQKAGRFREDLFYRLNVISVVLPP